MPLETATYIPDLVSANPAHTDGLSQADSHLRLLKSTIKATFPNFTDVALASTQAQIDAVVTAAPIVTAYLVPPGAIVDFGMATAPTGWLACDGQAVSRTTYASLFTAISTTWGAGDGSTTFNVPGLMSRFRRHRDVAGLDVAGDIGNTQSPKNLTHTHDVSGTTANENTAHNHSFSGTTGIESNTHTHGYNQPASFGFSGGGSGIDGTSSAGTTATQSANHTHTYSGSTGTESFNHAHAFTATSSVGSADTNEARPYSATVLTCIKF